MHASLIQKLDNKSALIGIVGVGYVGLPLLLRFAEVGYHVKGFDIDPQKIDKLSKGQSYFTHIKSEAIQKVRDRFAGTTDFSEARECDALIICVPTPLNEFREPDLSFVTNTMDMLQPYFRAGQIISLESTTYPGTTDEVLKPYFDQVTLQVGVDIFLSFSPEREDPGNPNFSTASIPKVCSGYSGKCLEASVALYRQIINKVVPVSSTKTAEMTKLLENIHRAVNIGLVNELKVVCDKMGIDIFEVVDAAASKPFGFVPYYPGPGIGGHCIPIDPFYLTWKAREYNVHTRFIELAGEINGSMPIYVFRKIADALNRHEKSVKNSKFLILGIAYKRNIDDMRESPSVALMEVLQEKGALIQYSDPYVPVFPKMRKHHFDLQSVTLTPDVIRGFDCVVVATDHHSFDYDMIKENATLIVDTRGVYRHERNPKIVRA